MRCFSYNLDLKLISLSSCQAREDNFSPFESLTATSFPTAFGGDLILRLEVGNVEQWTLWIPTALLGQSCASLLWPRDGSAPNHITHYVHFVMQIVTVSRSDRLSPQSHTLLGSLIATRPCTEMPCTNYKLVSLCVWTYHDLYTMVSHDSWSCESTHSA